MVIQKHKSSLPKAAKITFSSEIIKKSEKTPGVGKYELLKKNRILGNYKYNQERNGFTENAMFNGLQSPSTYDHINTDIYKNKTYSAKIWTQNKPRFPKIEKNDSPSPNTYQQVQSFMKTQNTSISYQVPKAKQSSFTAQIIEKKKFVPSVGHYNIGECDKRLSKGTSKSFK